MRRISKRGYARALKTVKLLSGILDNIKRPHFLIHIFPLHELNRFLVQLFLRTWQSLCLFVWIFSLQSLKISTSHFSPFILTQSPF